MNALLAGLHYLALGLGFASITLRAHGFSQRQISTVLRADNGWGIASLLWILSGLWRALGGLEKGESYYAGNLLFWLKMGLFGLIFLLELRPMITLIRLRLRQESTLSPSQMQRFSRISWIQTALLCGVVFCASFMARGYGVIK